MNDLPNNLFTTYRVWHHDLKRPATTEPGNGAIEGDQCASAKRSIPIEFRSPCAARSHQPKDIVSSVAKMPASLPQSRDRTAFRYGLLIVAIQNVGPPSMVNTVWCEHEHRLTQQADARATRMAVDRRNMRYP